MFEPSHHELSKARELDRQDPLSVLRQEFERPLTPTGEEQLYFAGHSLGLMPKRTRTYIQEELDEWGRLGVEGHFHAKRPWLPYHELMSESLARLVGAKPTEVVAMNSLTVNLHLALTSFYRPTPKRFKILIENNTFPSDKYAVDSQARFHGFAPKEAIVELKPQPGKMTLSDEEILEQINALGDELALVMLGNCNYLSGQCFPFEKITKRAHELGAFVGFNLAHGAGNLELKLHEWNLDFAVWCSYKYLNSGPGGMAGAFFHERHHQNPAIPRFEGWWGHDKRTRFKMGPDFAPIPSAEAWQLSNPPIFQLAALRASLDLFDQAGMKELRARGDRLTNYLEWRFREKAADNIEIVTPEARGSMLCIKVKKDPRRLYDVLKERHAIVDFREPDILRMTPAPLYNSYEDIHRLTQLILETINE
jgi:kynureninase